MKLIGVLMMLLGLGLIAYSVWFLHAPMEEPANPGKTPNPSIMEREMARLERKIFIHRHVLPALGLLTAVFGAWLLLPERPRARESP